MTREEALNKTIGILTYHQVNFCKSKEAVANMNEIIEALEKIEQEPCDDAISRQVVLDTIGNVPDYDDGMVWEALSHAQRDVALLPSVTPQPNMGHCKDCKYFEYDSVAKVNGIPIIVAHEICKRWGDGCKTSEDGYCFLFEPKTQEVEE